MHDYIPRKTDINGQIHDVTAKQYDHLSRYIHLQIFDEDLSEDDDPIPMNLVGCEARIYVDIPEQNPEFADGEIADGENGIVTFTLPNSVTQEAGNYNCEIWITQPSEQSVISTRPFLLRVEKSIRNDNALQATEKFSALENTLIRVAVDRARLDNLTALANSANVVPGTVDSEVVDIRTGYDGTIYATAGNAVREQINEIKNSVAAMAEFLSAIDGNYKENEEAAQFVSDLKNVLERANSFQWQIDQVNRSMQNIIEYIPNGGITEGKLCDNAVSADKLSMALKRPSIVLSSGTVAEMLWCAESYFNYAYTGDGKDSGILYESHAGLYSESLGKGSENRQYSIVCSSFVDAILNAITFENSRYNGSSENIKQSWGVEFDETGVFGTAYEGQTEEDKQILSASKYLSSQNLAKYAAEHGYLYKIDGSANIRAGDVLFSGNMSGRYLNIDHCAVVINADNNNCTLLEAWDAVKTDIDGTEHSVGLRINYRAPISKYTYGATFPLGGVANEPIVLESVHDLSGETAKKATLIHEFKDTVKQGFYTVVCHGEFSGAPYVSLKYDGADNSVFQSVMHSVGSDYYLTVYVQKPAVISLRMTENNTYNANEISLYKGYAEMTAQNSTAAMLGAGDDIDECLDGVWYCQNTETAANIIHAPLSDPTGGFRLESARMTNGSRYMQTLWYVGSPEKVYVRMYISTGWTGWFVYSGTAV